MVKDGILRVKKYSNKFDADVVKQRFSALKDVSIELQAQHLTKIAELEDIVKKQILEPKGLTTLEIKNYLLFVRALYGLTQKISSGFSGETLRNQELAKRSYFVSMGLNDEILKEISRKFGIDPKPLPIGEFIPEYKGRCVGFVYYIGV